MKTFIFFFVMIAFTGITSGQCEGDVILNSQDDVDNFNCTEVMGSLSIWGAITNLDGLSNLTSVGGALRIHTTTVFINLDGLSNLTTVGSSWGMSLSIHDNALLANLDGDLPPKKCSNSLL